VPKGFLSPLGLQHTQKGVHQGILSRVHDIKTTPSYIRDGSHDMSVINIILLLRSYEIITGILHPFTVFEPTDALTLVVFSPSETSHQAKIHTFGTDRIL